MIIEYEGQIKRFNNIWFTSDFHFLHSGIISLCNRPFNSVEEMDITLLQNLNSRVQKDDLLIFLGDFCNWKKNAVQNFHYYINQIVCDNILWIWGNHDRKIKGEVEKHKKVIWCGDYLDVVVDGQQIALFHYPLLADWNGQYSGGIATTGHIHDKNFNVKNSFNLCVEQTDYKPIHFDELIKRRE